MTAAHRSLPGWFYLLAAVVVVAGVAGSAAMILIHAAFGGAQALRDDPAFTLGSSAAPVVVAAAWAWLAVRLARRGRFRIGVGMLAFAGVLIAMTLFLIMGPV